MLAANGGVVLQIGARIEVLRDDGLPVRVIFDKVPPNLRARPTLSVTLDSVRAGRAPGDAQLSDARASAGRRIMSPCSTSKAGTIDVQGWITLTNTTGTTFDNADTLLVAGDVDPATASGYRCRRGPHAPAGHRKRRPASGSAISTSIRSAADHDRQPADQAGQLPRRQRRAGAPRLRISQCVARHTGPGRERRQRAPILQRRGHGLGDALPAGTVRVYQRDSRGKPQFVGENRIGHTPMGSDSSASPPARRSTSR